MDEPVTCGVIQSRLVAAYSRRAIRYAIAELIKSGKIKRKGQSGPVYAVANGECS